MGEHATQPIAIADVIRYLVGVLDEPAAEGRVFEIGGPDVLEYAEMMRRVGRLEGRRTIVVPVPLLTPGLSSRWLSLVTDVTPRPGRSLIDSMSTRSWFATPAFATSCRSSRWTTTPQCYRHSASAPRLAASDRLRPRDRRSTSECFPRR